MFLSAATMSANKGIWKSRKTCAFWNTCINLRTAANNQRQWHTNKLLCSALFFVEEHACISMLSPQHPFSPGSCVGPPRCGKILHAPGRPWPLNYGHQKLRMCAWESEREREKETTGTGDDRGNRRRMCFCHSTDSVILQMTFPSN